MAELLVKAISATHTDPVKDARGCYKRTDIVDERPDGFTWGVAEGLPNFVVIKAPGIVPIKDRMDSWWRRIGFTIVNTNPAIDGYRIDAYVQSAYVGSLNQNALTRSQVETYLNRWNAVVVSTSMNQVRFDVSIYGAATSQGFWHRNVSAVVFSEISYNESTGIHRIHADFSYLFNPIDLTEVQELVLARGGTVVGWNVPQEWLRFDIGRDAVRNQFQEDVKNRVDDRFKRRRYRMPESWVSQAEANGGMLVVSDLNNVIDKYNE